MRIYILLGLCCLACGCVNDRMGPRLASWQGSHFNEIAVAWGPPDKCINDTSQRVCEWRQLPASGTACTTMLAFDDNNTVTGWRWRGDRCQQAAPIVASNETRARPAALSLDGVEESASDAAATR